MSVFQYLFIVWISYSYFIVPVKSQTCTSYLFHVPHSSMLIHLKNLTFHSDISLTNSLPFLPTHCCYIWSMIKIWTYVYMLAHTHTRTFVDKNIFRYLNRHAVKNFQLVYVLPYNYWYSHIYKVVLQNSEN